MIHNLDSLIIENNIKYNQTLKNWIEPNMKIKTELLYRMSRDGIEYSKFHNLCDNKGATITLIKLEDGNILGIYTPLSWDSTSNDWKNDLNMFVFNLTENIKCIKNNKNSYGIYCHSNCGPHTDAIQFSNKKMNQIYINPNSSHYNECKRLYPDKNKGYYKTDEIEIFQIIIN